MFSNLSLELCEEPEITSQDDLFYNALLKKPKTREVDDHNLITQNIYNLKYFQNIVSHEEERFEFVKGCAKYFKYKCYPKGSEIFRKGDKGQKFYIILKGDAFVYIPKSHEEIEKDCLDEEKIKTWQKYQDFMIRSVKKKFLTRQLSKEFDNHTHSHSRSKSEKGVQKFHLTKEEAKNMILSEDNSILSDQINKDLSFEEKLLFVNDTRRETIPYFIQGTAVYKKITSLKEGECFGELALIFNQPRMASIIAKDDLHVLSLKSDDFQEVFQSQITNTLEKVKFFQNIFKTIPKEEIIRFCHFLEEKSFKFNDVIHKEGDVCAGIYFIKQGDIQLSKSSKKGLAETKRSNRRESFCYRRVVVASLLSGSLFGDYETITNLKVNYTVTCNSSTRVYKLKKQTYGIIEKHFSDLFKIIQENAFSAEETRKARLENNKKIQQSVLFSKEERLLEQTEQEIQYEMTLFTEEDIESAKNNSVDFKSMHLSSSRIPRLSFKLPKDCSISTLASSNILESAGNSHNDFMNSSTPANKNKGSKYGTPKGIRLPSVNCEDVNYSPNSTSKKVTLPSINSPKSCFSTVPRENNDEGGFTSIVNKLKTNASWFSNKRNSHDSTPTNYVNIVSSNYEQPQKTKNIESIFASAAKNLPERHSIMTEQSDIFQVAATKKDRRGNGGSFDLHSTEHYREVATPRMKIKAIKNLMDKKYKCLEKVNRNSPKQELFERLF